MVSLVVCCFGNVAALLASWEMLGVKPLPIVLPGAEEQTLAIKCGRWRAAAGSRARSSCSRELPSRVHRCLWAGKLRVQR